MKAFGFSKADSKAELPVELRESTLALSAAEIELVISFLQHAKVRFETCSSTPGQSHLHLRDWWKGWTASDPDLIIVMDENGLRPPPPPPSDVMNDIFWKASPKEIGERFRQMTHAEARRFLEEYLQRKDERLLVLNEAFYKGGGGNEDDLDFTPDSLIPLWNWASRQMHSREFTKLELAHINGLPDWFREDQLKNKNLSEPSLILVNDVAYYFAEVLVQSLKGVKWGIESTKMRRVIDENQPILLGFRITINPREAVRIASLEAARGESDDAALLHVFEKCYNLLPPSGSTST